MQFRVLLIGGFLHQFDKALIFQAGITGGIVRIFFAFLDADAAETAQIHNSGNRMGAKFFPALSAGTFAAADRAGCYFGVFITCFVLEHCIQQAVVFPICAYQF